MTVTTCRNVPRVFRSMDKALNGYEKMKSRIEKLSKVKPCYFLVNGHALNPYWGSALTEKQKKKFDKLFEKACALPAVVLHVGAKVESLSAFETETSNVMLLNLAEKAISAYDFSSKLRCLPLGERNKLYALRDTLFRVLHTAFESVFAHAASLSLFTKDELFEQWHKRYESTGIMQLFDAVFADTVTESRKHEDALFNQVL